MSVAVIDSRAEPPGLADLRRELPAVPVFTGGFDDEVFAAAERLVVSPGVPVAEPHVRAARERGAEILGVTAIQIWRKKLKPIQPGSKGTRLGWGKVEFCLTKLQALPATSLTRAASHLVDVLNAFGLFARAERDRSSTSVECGLLLSGAGASTFHRGARRR